MVLRGSHAGVLHVDSVGCVERSGVGNVPITPLTQMSTAWVLGVVHYQYLCLLMCVVYHQCVFGLLSLYAAFSVSSV
jgi:hypothetical protein